jgi:hypothetical protein
MKTVGYSRTPLATKLGIKEGVSFLLVNGPDHYFTLFSDFPENVDLQAELKDESIDFIHLFVQYQRDLEKFVVENKPLLKKNGTMWVSWPKGKSKIETDLKREPIREYLLDVGLVDVKVCAVDEDWSALKFVYRVKDR